MSPRARRRAPARCAARTSASGSTRGLPALGPLTEAQRTLDQPFGLAEAALEQGQERLGHRDVPQLRGLLEPLGDAGRRLELGPHIGQVADLQGRLQAPEVALKRALLVPGLVQEGGQLGHDGGALLARVRSPDDHVPPVEGIGQRRRIPMKNRLRRYLRRT